MAAPSHEKRPLKRPRLGPPDVYPQDPKQKEDELTATNVKMGFTTTLQIQDEYGTARYSNITAAKIGTYFTAIIAKKHELNTFQDSGRKKQQINPKDSFWPVTARSKNAIEAWFKDLAGSKPLTSLAKKVPIFNKKEEIFMTLYEYSVPLLRAAWFIKMTSAYTVAISEAKIKKRQLTDPCQEWTQTLTRFLREQLQKVTEYYHTGSPVVVPITSPTSTTPTTTTTTTTSTTNNTTTSATTPSSQPTTLSTSGSGMTTEVDIALKQWHYCTQLVRYLYEDGLLDRQDFLTWVLELLEKTKMGEDGILKLITTLALQYIDEFTHCELLSRRLAYFCARKLSQMCVDSNAGSPRTQSPLVTTNANGNPGTASANQTPLNPVAAAFMEYINCPHHRSIVLSLCAMLQVIVLDCPTALVWNNVGDGKTSSALNGSPLDLLPCAPSSLPMPPRPDNPLIRARLKSCETQIRLRGQAAEVRWSYDKWQQSTASATINRVLTVLDALDRHCFDKVDSTNSIDTLYAKIFPAVGSKDHNENVGNDESIVQLLCEWAVCTQRSGEHRALVVAKLLEKRQTELSSEKYSDSDAADEKDSISSTSMVPPSIPIFQNLLMKFLDTDAPTLEPNPSQETKMAFSNLVLLFSELMRSEVFSHDAYMCTLISRGSLASNHLGAGVAAAVGMVGPSIIKPTTPGDLGLLDTKPESIKQDLLGDSRSLFEPGSIKHEDPYDLKMDLDDAKIDDDLDKLLQHIKQEQQNNIEQPDSVGSDKGEPTPLTSVTPLTTTTPIAPEPQPVLMNRPSRHLLFSTHFPLSQDDGANHDCNQRHVLLYGVGKAREEAKHVIKKMNKEIMKLFGKRCILDAAEGGKLKKHPSRGDFNFEAMMSKFQHLSYFDRHVVTTTCTSAVIEVLNNFASGSSNYLPVVEHVSFLLDLMEVALNVHGLIDFCIQMLKELVDVEALLVSKSANLAGSYTTSLTLYVAGILRRYHCCLLVSQEQTAAAFEGLCKIVKHVSNPTDCTSAERCILVHLYDLYTSCSFLKSKHFEPFSNACAKVKQTLYTSVHPSALNLLWNTTFMIDHINNPKEFISIPKTKLDPQLIKQLNESPANRYSFVCNAVVNICNTQDSDRLNEISILCAELTACCSALSSEWLGVLGALCCSSNHQCGFIDVLTQVDVVDLSIHDSLALFTSILIARHCFSLHDFVVEVAMPSLLAACSTEGGSTDPDAEPGARLTCHLLLQIFKTVETPQPLSYSSGMSPAPLPLQKPVYAIKLSCDRQLLAAAHHSITAGAVVAVLKAILFLGDAAVGESKSRNTEARKNDSGELSISNILGTIVDDPDLEYGLGANVPILAKPSGAGIESAGLSEFAKHALKQICSQEWVHDRCLKDPEQLCTQGFLVDHMLSNKQAQQLLHMICYPYSPQLNPEEQLDQKQMITRILQNLDQWTLRVSSLELQLMYKHCSPNSSELNLWLDNVARATIDVFQLQTEDHSKAGSSKGDSKAGITTASTKLTSDKPSSIWLVAPLVSKLHPSVQGRVLRMAGQVLESGNWSSKSKDKDKNVQRSTSLLSHQPFLSLVLTCLKGQDEQREGLLTSLHSQLSQFLHLSKDEKFHTEDSKVKQAMQDALQLRLSLVGGMFDTIQRSSSITTDWSVLLVQLISHGVIDTQTNSELFTTVLDMLSMLIHNTLASESISSDKGEETKKLYQNLIKKLKKELADRNSDAISQVRQLLPLPRQQCEVITCEPMGSLIDTKGNKIAGFDSIDKKQGLQVSEKQKVSPWDLLEGHKNPAPLSWSWFGAIRVERKPLKYEEVHRLLQYHTHSMKKPPSYYLDPPPLPPEDLEPEKHIVGGIIMRQELQMKEEKGREIPINDQPPRAPIGAKKAKAGRKKRGAARNATMAAQPMMTAVRPSQVRQMGYPEQPIYPQAPHQNWYPQQQQQPYYNQQQLPPAAGPRFDQRISQTSKLAITNMLRARQPNTQYIQGASQQVPTQPQPANFTMDMVHKPRQMRHSLRAQHAATMQPSQTSMFPQHMQQTVGQTGSLHHISQQGIHQNYGNYSSPMQQPGQMVDPSSGGMIPTTFTQSYSTTPNPVGMMPGMRATQSNFLAQPAQQRGLSQTTRPQYQLNQAAMQAPNVSVNQLSNTSNLTQMGTGYSRPMQGLGTQATSASHMQQLRQQQQQQQHQQQQQQQQQQQLLAMQQQAAGQNPQTMTPAQQQQQAQLVAHLQQLNTSGQHPFHQHNTFG